MSQKNTVKMFYGAASGQQRSSLRRLEPEAVMISYATQNNTPWDGDYRLFVDSGGFHQMETGNGEYEDSNDDYLAYLRDHEPDLWAHRDYPCERELLKSLGRSVKDHQERTTEKHIELADADVPGQPVAVVQGWSVDQYLTHLDSLRDHGLLTEYVGIGTVCGRDNVSEIAEIITAIRDALPKRIKLHAFGVKGNVLRFTEVCDALASADSAAYDWAVSRHPSKREDGETYTWRDCARAYLNWRKDLLQEMGSVSPQGDRSTQTTLKAQP